MEPTNTNTDSELSTADSSKGRRGARHKLTHVQDEVCRLYQAGIGAKSIGATYGVSVTCVIATLRRCGVAIRAKGRHRVREI